MLNTASFGSLVDACAVSDDMLIKLWDWEKKWICTQVFEGHTHYVMQIVINPKDNNTFASCSLDRTVKVCFIFLRLNNNNIIIMGKSKPLACDVMVPDNYFNSHLADTATTAGAAADKAASNKEVR